MKRWNICECILAVVAAIFLASSAYAQTSSGTIVGLVTDQTGAVVPNATVKVVSREFGGEPRVVTTNSVGGYRVEPLSPGTYLVTIDASGFAELTLQDVNVEGSLTVTVNATLTLGTVKHVIVVEGSAAQELKTDSGELGAEISKVEVENLPFFSLNPVELVLGQPGVQDSTNQYGFSNGENFSVNGTRPRANNFLIDGQDNNDNGIAGQAFQTVNLGEVQEVTILTNAYSAEFGRGGGSVTNEISRRGSNDFHGEAWEINRNSAFAAVPADVGRLGTTKNPFDNENTFGFDFGGPVKHNKLFVYGTSQWDREHQSVVGSALLLPDANGVAKLQSLLPNSNVQLLLQALGGLTAPSSGPNLASIPLGPDANKKDRGVVEVNQLQRHVTSIGLDRQWNTRLDWNATTNDTVSGSYRRDDGSLTPDFFNSPFTLPQFDTFQDGAGQGFIGNWTHTFSPVAVNETRFSYSNIGFHFDPKPASVSGPLGSIANFSFAGTAGSAGFPQFGNVLGEPQGRAHKSYQFQDAVSYAVGRHSFKFGGDVDFVQVDDLIPFNSLGTLTFQDGGGFTDLGNFVDNFTGATGSIAINFGNPEVQPLETIYSPYFQDSWRVRENLTLDLGLRYEYWGVPGNIAQFPSISAGFLIPGATFPQIAAVKQQGDKNNFAPRVGLAYTPHFWTRLFGHDKTVFRAGYGIFYDGLFTNILDNTESSSPNVTGLSLTGPSKSRGLANATGLLAQAVPVPSPLVAIQSMSSHLLNPLTHQWNADIQRELPGRFVLTAAYVGTRGEHLYANQSLNPVNPLAPPLPNGNAAHINPTFGEVDVRDNAGDSIYHSAQLSLDRKFSSGFLLRGAYTYSKFIDDTSEVFVTSGLSSFSQNLLCQRCDRGLSSYDRRHRGVITYIWDVPYVHSTSNLAMGIVSQITRGWQWSGTLTMQTGSPEVLHDGFDANGDGHAQDRPSIGNASLPLTSRGIDGVQIGATATPGTFFDLINCVLNPAPTAAQCAPKAANNFHFIIPASGIGNVGRNTFLGPGQVFYNTSVQRSFKIPMRHMERQALTFRGEFFNAFNHPNLFTDPPGFSSDIFSLLNTQHFLDFNQTIAGGRQIKLWLKYQF